MTHEYVAPSVSKIGSFEEITQANVGGSVTDIVLPVHSVVPADHLS